MPLTPDRSLVAGNFLLELEGAKASVLKSVEGGGVVADVVLEHTGATYYREKHIGQPRYEPFGIEVGVSTAKDLIDWIAASWQGKYARRNGAIVATDHQNKERSRREFFDALVTEVTIPACDGASKEPAYMTVKLAPQYTRSAKGSGKATTAPAAKQKQWLPQNFKLEIDGLDATKVSRLDAFTVRQTAATDDIGEARDYLKEPGKLEFPNLGITLAEASAQTWLDWFDDFVIKGNNGEEQEKSGKLTFLSPDRKTELGQVRFFNLGIFKLAPDKAEARAETIRRLRAELYCERMELGLQPPVKT